MLISKQIIIERNCHEVLAAFLETRHTETWWQGCQTFFQKEQHVLSWYWRDAAGNFQSVTHGQVAAYEAGLFLLLRDCWQYSQEAPEPIGPVELLIECTPHNGAGLLVIRHDCFTETGEQWKAYAEAVSSGWDIALQNLKSYLEMKNLS
jgi:uncharacterized protein YndB with AHSA1/START domain